LQEVNKSIAGQLPTQSEASLKSKLLEDEARFQKEVQHYSKTFIEGLPNRYSETELRDLIKPHTPFAVVMQQEDKRSAALVTTTTKREASSIYDLLHNRYLGQGNRVVVSMTGVEAASRWHETISLPFAARCGVPDYSRIAPSGQPSVSHTLHVVTPSNLALLRRIHQVIELVVGAGPAAEAVLLEKECENPDFEFLFNPTSQEHVYYRWKLFSLLNGDDPLVSNTAMVRIFDDDVQWIPPEDAEEDANLLLASDRNLFLWQLRCVQLRRGSIASAMWFALEHPEAAEEIVDILVSSLLNANTPNFQRLARLFIISDVLHNASTGASTWKYRQL